MKRAYAALALLAVSLAGPAAARAPIYDSPPPGQIVQDVPANLTAGARWHVIASKKFAGRMMGTTPVYQWYVSFYAPAQDGKLHLMYRSPGDSSLLAKVEKAHNALMYFPVQQLSITGAAALERQGVQDVVLWSHESAADCGTAAVTILGADQAMNIGVRKRIVNYCSLQPTIVSDGALAAVRLEGPYYEKNSAMCCPAQPKATAIVRYSGGAWTVIPPYFPPEGSALP